MPDARPQATVTFRRGDRLWARLRRAERLTGKTRGAIVRELLDYFLDVWVSREEAKVADERQFREALQRLAMDDGQGPKDASEIAGRRRHTDQR